MLRKAMNERRSLSGVAKVNIDIFQDHSLMLQSSKGIIAAYAPIHTAHTTNRTVRNNIILKE